MKIAATVLLGPECGPKLKEAFDSVRELVDGFVCIESGGGMRAREAAVEAAGELFDPGIGFAWSGDYGAARQHALNQAKRLGYDWAVTLDPDERVHLGATALVRAALADYPDISVWEAKHDTEGYSKERIISCHVPGQWVGRSCEYYDHVEGKVGGMGTFSELPHPPGHMKDRFLRGLDNMRIEMAQDPDNPRWVRHLAACYSGLGMVDDALFHMGRALTMFREQGLLEHASWANFQIAELHVGRAELDEAFDHASKGMAMHAGLMPEHGSILAYVEYRRSFDEKVDKAIRREHLQNAGRWAQLVLACPEDRTRRFFKSPHCRQNAADIFHAIYPERTVPVAFERAAE